jgi:hypothetical protein
VELLKDADGGLHSQIDPTQEDRIHQDSFTESVSVSEIKRYLINVSIHKRSLAVY